MSCILVYGCVFAELSIGLGVCCIVIDRCIRWQKNDVRISSTSFQRGAGEVRTLVHTGNLFAFYMFSFDCIVGVGYRPKLPSPPLAYCVSSRRLGIVWTISDFPTPPCRWPRRVGLRVMSRHSGFRSDWARTYCASVQAARAIVFSPVILCNSDLSASYHALHAYKPLLSAVKCHSAPVRGTNIPVIRMFIWRLSCMFLKILELLYECPVFLLQWFFWLFE